MLPDSWERWWRKAWCTARDIADSTGTCFDALCLQQVGKLLSQRVRIRRCSKLVRPALHARTQQRERLFVTLVTDIFCAVQQMPQPARIHVAVRCSASSGLIMNVISLIIPAAYLPGLNEHEAGGLHKLDSVVGDGIVRRRDDNACVLPSLESPRCHEQTTPAAAGNRTSFIGH